MTTPYFISQGFFLAQTDCIAFSPRRTAKLMQRVFPDTLEILSIKGEAGLILEQKLIWHQSTNRDLACQWVRGMIAAMQEPFDLEDLHFEEAPEENV